MHVLKIQVVVIWPQIIVPSFHREPSVPDWTPAFPASVPLPVLCLQPGVPSGWTHPASQSSPCPSLSVCAASSMRSFLCLFNGSVLFHGTFGSLSLCRSLQILISLVVHCFVYGCSSMCWPELKRDLIVMLSMQRFL